MANGFGHAIGHGQMGYGLGGLFRSLAKAAKPIVKSGAKELGKFALNTGVNLPSHVLAGKSVKESAKARGLEGAGVAKTRVVQRAQMYAQTGRGRRHHRGGKRTKRLSTRSRSISRGHIRLNMSLVHSKSEECSKTELDLFSVPPTQVTLEKGHWVDHLPVSSVSEGGSITFLCPGTEDYVDFPKQSRW